MSVKIVSAIQKRLGVTSYRLAKMLGVSQQIVRVWNGTTETKTKREGMNLKALCRLRKISGMSWEQFGKELDREFYREVDSDSEKGSR